MQTEIRGFYMDKNVKSTLSDDVLGERLISLSEGFLRVYLKKKTAVHFSRTDVVKSSWCGTIACHGGFGLIILSELTDQLEKLPFTDGADRIARYLGFQDRLDLKVWAKNHPELWGNRDGFLMFDATGGLAFGYPLDEPYTGTLLVIAQWYANVAARVLGQPTREIDYV